MSKTARLTKDQIENIRSRITPSTSLNELARELGFSSTTIYKYSGLPKSVHQSKEFDNEEISQRLIKQNVDFLKILEKFEHVPVNVIDTDKIRFTSYSTSASYASCSLDW